MTALNHQLIRTLRHARGNSHRQVGDHLGVNGVVIAGIEDGTNHSDLPLRIVTGLADLLGVHAGRLFDDQPAEADGDEELVRKAGAILHTADGPVRIEAIAELCDTDLPTTRQAIEALKQRVRRVGGVVAESDGGLSLHADQQTVDDADAVGRTVRRVHARQGLSPTEARVLDEHRGGDAEYAAFRCQRPHRLRPAPQRRTHQGRRIGRCLRSTCR